MRKKNSGIWLIIAAWVLFLTACSGLEKIEQPEILARSSLTGDQIIGQTFVPRYDGLEAVSLYLEPLTPGPGKIQFNIKNSPGDPVPLRSAVFNLDDLRGAGYYPFLFSPVSGSKSKNLYFELTLDGDGSVQVGTGPGLAYLNGSMVENQAPVDAQLAFRLTYKSDVAIVGLIKEFSSWAWYLGIALLLFMVPGWALAGLLLRSWSEMVWLERAGIAISAGLAIYPLILLWTNLIGLQLGEIIAWTLPVAGIAMVIWQNRGYLHNFPENLRRLAARLRASLSIANIALISVILLLIFTRFWAIRSLDAPMWGDSYQHSVITQLMIDHRGLFESWQPYVELDSFTYHFGFHSLAAAYHWITGLPAYLSVMWIGQILNIFAIICLYPLARRMNPNPWCGVVVLLFAGLLSSVPMFYVNWGRYTQLAGLVILPGLVWTTWITGDKPQPDRRSISLASLLLAGLALTHYRILIFALGWFISVLILNAESGNLKKTFPFLFITGIWATILVSPWLANVVLSEFMDWITALFPTAAIRPALPPPAVNPFTFLPNYLLFVLVFLTGWGLWRRNKGYSLLLIWWIIVVLVANLRLLHLPFTGLDNFTVQISIYIPASLILGESAGWLSDAILTGVSRQSKIYPSEKTSFKKIVSIFLVILLVGLSLWGMRRRLWDVQPDVYALVTRPDIKAFEWIRENTNPDDGFLVNSFFAFNHRVIVGSDGGWWLPLLANRRTTTPPLNYNFESGSTPDFLEKTNQLIQIIEDKGLNDASVIEMLKKRGIRYIYVGQRHGSVNSPQPLISIDRLLNSPFYEPVYHEDGVWIFKLKST